MPTNVGEWDTDADNNTDVGGINIAEGMAPSGVNNAMREIMAQIRGFFNREISTVEEFTGDYTVTIADRSKLLRFPTGDHTLTLIAPATLTNGWFCWVGSGTGTTTIDPSAAVTIDGNATLVLPPGSEVGVFCDGSAFHSVGFILAADSNGFGLRTLSTDEPPSGTGTLGDIWYQRE